MGDLITATQLQNMLKDYYMKTEQDKPMEVYVKMYDDIYKNTKDVDGIAVKAIAKVKRNLGIVTSAYTDVNEPTAGSRGYERASVAPRFIKAKGSFDQQLVLMSKTDTGAFVKELAAVTEDLDQSVKLNLARQIFNDGSSKLCEITAPVTAANPATVYVHTTQYLEVGMPCSIYTAAGVYVESITLITVDPETNSFTANVANNQVALSALYYGESTSVNSKDTEITGLNTAINNSGTYFGINRTTYPVWRGQTYGVGSALSQRPAALSEVNASKVINGIMKRSRSQNEKGETSAYDFAMMDFEAYTAYWSSLTATRRYNDNVNYKTGVTGVMFDDKQIERDAYAIKEHAAITKITSYTEATDTYVVGSTAGLQVGDKFEVITGNTFIAHDVVLSITNGTTFVGTNALTINAVAAGTLIYLDNGDTTGAVQLSAPRVFHNMYFINKDTWQWYVWQDITNYTEQLIGLEFVKVANKTQYEFTLTGMMELFCETPTKNGRYRFTIDAALDSALSF